MTTFSQLCDEAALEHLRPDLLHTTKVIQSYLNETIREVHFNKQPNDIVTPVLYESNRLEDTFAPVTFPAVWPIPSVPRFQRFEVAFYRYRNVYASKRDPGVALRSGYQNDEPYWYRSGSNIVFNGVKENEEIRLSWFEFPKFLTYYPEPTQTPPGVRPCNYNSITDEFTYDATYNVDDDSRALAQERTTNWLILRWAEVLREGVRAKVYKRLGDDARGSRSYSLYEGLRDGLRTSEEFYSEKV